MQTVIAALSSIPMGLGFFLGVLGMIPALPAMFGKPPSGWIMAGEYTGRTLGFLLG